MNEVFHMLSDISRHLQTQLFPPISRPRLTAFRPRGKPARCSFRLWLPNSQHLTNLATLKIFPKSVPKLVFKVWRCLNVFEKNAKAGGEDPGRDSTRALQSFSRCRVPWVWLARVVTYCVPRIPTVTQDFKCVEHHDINMTLLLKWSKKFQAGKVRVCLAGRAPWQPQRGQRGRRQRKHNACGQRIHSQTRWIPCRGQERRAAARLIRWSLDLSISRWSLVFV